MNLNIESVVIHFQNIFIKINGKVGALYSHILQEYSSDINKIKVSRGSNTSKLNSLIQIFELVKSFNMCPPLTLLRAAMGLLGSLGYAENCKSIYNLLIMMDNSPETHLSMMKAANLSGRMDLVIFAYNNAVASNKTNLATHHL